MSVDTSRLAAALEAEKVRREREIESLQQRQSEAERGISELQSELAEHQLKAALLQQTHQPSAAASDHLEREQEVIGVVCYIVVFLFHHCALFATLFCVLFAIFSYI